MYSLSLGQRVLLLILGLFILWIVGGFVEGFIPAAKFMGQLIGVGIGMLLVARALL